MNAYNAKQKKKKMGFRVLYLNVCGAIRIIINAINLPDIHRLNSYTPLTLEKKC